MNISEGVRAAPASSCWRIRPATNWRSGWPPRRREQNCWAWNSLVPDVHISRKARALLGLRPEGRPAGLGDLLWQPARLHPPELVGGTSIASSGAQTRGRRRGGQLGCARLSGAGTEGAETRALLYLRPQTREAQRPLGCLRIARRQPHVRPRTRSCPRGIAERIPPGGGPHLAANLRRARGQPSADEGSTANDCGAPRRTRPTRPTPQQRPEPAP